MIRIGISAFLLITLIGISIGANNMTRFEKGYGELSSRYDYCKWIQSEIRPNEIDDSEKFAPSTMPNEPSIRSFAFIKLIDKKLRSYHERKIKLTYLPQAMKTTMLTLQERYQKRLTNIDQMLQLLRQENKHLKISTSHNDQEKEYRMWRLENELPGQIFHLETEAKEVRDLVKRYADFVLSSHELYEVFRLTYTPDIEAKNLSIPSLAIEIHRDEGLFSSQVGIYPVWIEGKIISRASNDPYFSLSGTMVPKNLGHDFSVRRIPDTYSRYLALLDTGTHSPSQGDSRRIASIVDTSSIKMQFLDQNRLLIVGHAHIKDGAETHRLDPLVTYFTPTANIAIDGILDLGCIN